MFNYAWIYLGWHVASVTHTANGQNFTDAAFTYNNGSYYAATLVSPFGTALNGQPIPVAQLTGITFTGAPGQGGYTFTYNANGELTEVVFPHLGYFRYQYAEADFSSPPRATREVANRYIAANGYVAGNGGAPTEQTYSFTHPSDPNVASHINTTLQDASGNRKVWYFNQGSANGWDNGLEYQMDTQQGPSFSVLRRTQTGWTQDVTSPAPQPMSNPRVFGVTTALSDGVTQSRHEQDVDTTGLNGNVLAVREYAYGNLTTPYRTTTTTYLATTAYLQYNILNRPTEVKISDSSGTVVSDTTIAYDPSVPTGYLSSPSHDGNYSSVVTRGNPYQITRNGMAYTYTYDLGGNILTVLDPLYHTIQSNTYDSNGSQVVNSSAGGNNSSFVYGYDNDTTLLQQATGSNSDSTSFTYASYRPMSTTFADGTQETYAYLDNIYSNLPAGNPVAQDSISSLGKTTRTTFDGFGRTIRTAVREQTSPQVWITTQTVYAPCSCTPIGKPVQTSRPYRSDNQGNAISPDSAQLTTTTYDALGRPLTVALPDGATTSYNYSVAPDASAGSGAYTLITDPMGKQKGYFYDAFKELIRVDEPDSGGTLLETARYSYDRMGRMTQVQMGIPKVPVTDSGFESGLTGWTVTSGSAATASTAAAHSGSSSLLETATANVSQTFTGLTVGQVYTISAWAQVSGLAAATLVVDDSAGNNQGDTYTFTTNAAWQLLRVGYTVPANGKLRIQLIYGGSTGSVYWDNVSVVAEGSFTYKQTRTFVYNTKGQLTSSTTPEKGLVTYTYNADGTMATKTENTGSKTANPIQTQTLSYFYDSYDRLTSIQSPVGTVKSSYTYDTESNSALNSTNTGGRPAAVKNDGYTWHYSYDIMGRIQKQTLETPVNGSGGTALMMQSQYGFDNDGRMTDLYYPGAVAEVGSLAAGAHYQYAYDILGRASSLSAYGGATLASTPTTLSSAYNAAGQILSWTESSTTLTRVYNAQRGWTTGITAGSALNFAYTFNADGQVTGVTDSVNPAQSASYTYDNLNRLATAATSQWGLSWSYDDFGNRTAQTPTLGTPPQSNLTYDPTSNQITSAGYTFDAGGNLTAFPNTALSGTPTTSIAYDVFDRASTITTGSSSTTAKYDVFGHRVQQAFSGGITRVYFYNSGGQLLAEYDAPAAGNAPTRIKNYFSGQTVGQWTDRVGSKRADSASTSHYYPYGEEITSTNNDTYKFAQTYRDSSSGLDYAGYRYYASVIGRFATPDPTSSAGKRTPQSWNGYGYAGGDPVNNADPNGTCYSYVDAQGFIDTVGCDVDFNTNLPDFGFAANFAIQIAAAIAAINNAFGSSGNSGNGNGTFTPAPFPAYLVVEYDCYKKPREGQAAVRQITYWLFDSDGSRDTQGTITEIVTPTQGASKTGNNGVFVDQQTLFLPSAPPNNIAQSFWVTLPNGAQYNVFVRGFGGDFGTLGIYRTQKDISINGNIGGAIDSRTGVFRPNAICGDTGVL
jgi:RHS repeat-associated protein